MLRDALGNTHHQPNLRRNRLLYPRRRERRRNENRTSICTRLFDGIGDVGEDGFAEVLGAGLFGVRAADDVGAVFDGLRGVEGALPAGEALEDDFCVGG